ncbi:hypothetical protein [Bradyrhizobium liaoningense]|uniref:hypothetical protein n=1 Tax=Bradyrhizobium liaoningense TaxID=43992 RepID=UPI001BA50358|nr:hypothetical protein [Bradyrhizobium liaoningense]
MFRSIRSNVTNSVGTNFAGTINDYAQTRPGSIEGLGGDDQIATGAGPVTVNGGIGNDRISLQAGNSGVIYGGQVNDFISSQIYYDPVMDRLSFMAMRSMTLSTSSKQRAVSRSSTATIRSTRLIY